MAFTPADFSGGFKPPSIPTITKPTPSKVHLPADAGGTNPTSRAGSPSVRARQAELNRMGANLVIDGISGPQTRAAEAKYGGSGSSNSSSSSTSGDSSSGGSGGEGTGNSSTAVDRAASQHQHDRDVDALRAERLEAALAAIGTQFDFDEGQLKGQLDALKTLFKSTRKENARTGERNIEGIGDAAAERGIFRSGIAAEGLSDEFARQAEEKAQLVGALDYRKGREGTQVRDIMSAIALLGQQQASAESQAELQSEKDELDLEQLVALIGAGLQ